MYLRFISDDPSNGSDKENSSSEDEENQICKCKKIILSPLGPGVIYLFLMLNSIEHEISSAHKN